MSSAKLRWIGIASVIIGAASYGLLSTIIKLAYNDGWQEVQITASQVSMGALVLWVIVSLRPAAWSNPFRGPWIQLSLIGIFGLVLTTKFFNSSLSYLNVSLSMILLFQFTWMTVMLDAILLRKWPNRYQLIAIAVIMAGTVLGVGLDVEAIGQFELKGFILGLLSAVTYSLFITMTGRIRAAMDPVLKSAVMITAALPFLFIFYPPQLDIMSAPGGTLYMLLGWGLLLGLLGQVIPTITFNIGIPKIGSPLAASIGSLELPVAIVSAMVILNERVSALQWVGMALILAGVVISEKKVGVSS